MPVSPAAATAFIPELRLREVAQAPFRVDSNQPQLSSISTFRYLPDRYGADVGLDRGAERLLYLRSLIEDEG